MYKFLQKIPNFKGKMRLSGLLFKNKKEVRTFFLPNKIKFTVPNLIENVSFELFINGIYEEKYLNLITDNIPLNGTFIDVGANVGAISVLLAKRRPDIKIHAFEASPNVFKYLLKNKEQNGLLNLNVYNLAIHVKDDLELPFYSPLDLNGKGSFSPVFTNEAEMVKTLSLDTFFINNLIFPNFIKIDVEGFEALIFESMDIYLSSKNVCPILFEFVDWAEKSAKYEIGAAQACLLKKKFILKDLETGLILNNPILIGDKMILANK